MTDKEKIIAYIDRLLKKYPKNYYLLMVAEFIDSLQEEHKKCIYALNDFNDEDRKILCDGCEEDCEYSKKETVNDKLGGINNALVQDRLITSKPIGVPADAIELVSIPDKKEPISDDLEQAIDTYLATYFGGEKEKQDWPFLKKMAIHFANWQKQKDSIPVSEDLEKVIKEYYNSRREYGGKYNAVIPIYKSQLEDIAYYFAKWQKQQTISKACEWLNKNFTFIHPRKGVPVCAVNLNSFKDALNDEEV